MCTGVCKATWHRRNLFVRCVCHPPLHGHASQAAGGMDCGQVNIKSMQFWFIFVSVPYCVFAIKNLLLLFPSLRAVFL